MRARRQALSVSRAMHDRKAIVYELDLARRDRRHDGPPVGAPALLWGAAEAESERAPQAAGSTARSSRSVSSRIADAEFEEGRAAGRELSLEDAMALALDDAAERRAAAT